MEGGKSAPGGAGVVSGPQFFPCLLSLSGLYCFSAMGTRKRARKGGKRMEAMVERTAMLVHNFPVGLRLRVKSLAVVRRQMFAEVLAELVEKGLTTEEAKAARRKGKP